MVDDAAGENKHVPRFLFANNLKGGLVMECTALSLSLGPPAAERGHSLLPLIERETLLEDGVCSFDGVPKAVLKGVKHVELFTSVPLLEGIRFSVSSGFSFAFIGGQWPYPVSTLKS